MNKNIIITITIILVILILGLIIFKNLLTPTDDEVFTIQESRQVAENWILNNSSTYLFDGSNLEIISEQELIQGKTYSFLFSFESTSAGYGDRTDELAAQAITPHQIHITVREGNVISAITDEVYDEIKEGLIEGKTQPIEPISTIENIIPIKDCGFASFDIYKDVDNIIIACLGESLINNCDNAEATIKDPTLGSLVLKIKGSSIDDCYFEIYFPDKEGLQDHQQMFADAWISCPIKNTFGGESWFTKEEGEVFTLEETINNEQGEEAIKMLYVMSSMLAVDPEEASKKGCSGYFMGLSY